MIKKKTSIKQKNLYFINNNLLTIHLFYNYTNNQYIKLIQLTSYYFFVHNAFMYLC